HRLLPRRASPRHVAKIRVLERDPVVRNADRAALDELPPGAQHVVARSEPQRRAVEGAELLVARDEVLKLRAREEVAVEGRRRLRITAQPRFERPAAFERMRVAELE